MDSYVKIILVVFLIFVASIIFFMEARFGVGLIDRILVLPKSNTIYKQACANYVSNFLSVNYNFFVIITDNNLKEANLKKTQISPKIRVNLADKNNKINIVAIDNMKLSINNNTAYKLTCWINVEFNSDPTLITSYDVLFIKIDNISKDKNSFNIKEENY